MDKIQIIITLRKTVPDEATAKQIFETVKTKMLDHPDVTITGHITNHLEQGGQ